MLSPYRVVDLTDETGDFAGFVLAQLGAEVIAVEPDDGARSRYAGPFAGDEPGIERFPSALGVQQRQEVGSSFECGAVGFGGDCGCRHHIGRDSGRS